MSISKTLYTKALFVLLLPVLATCAEAPKANTCPTGTCPKGYGFFQNPDLAWNFSGIFRPEGFYGKNISLLNNDNREDQILFSRHTLDFNFDVLYGQKTYSCDLAKFRFTVRNKAVWGNPSSIASTTDTEVKSLNAPDKPHKHYIPRYIFWMREIWLKYDLAKSMGLSFGNEHSLTVGVFPFQLGRGISLGDAYAVGPEALGFYTDAAVDQFAPGVKFSGDVVKDVLTYDLYTAFLQNKATSLGETGEKILGQQYGKFNNPYRGFGILNVLIAGRLNWTVFDNDCHGSLELEPYALYNRDPEQRVEFPSDATSKLGTVGLAGEYEGDRWFLGFDTAQNFGLQEVKGWDRNMIVQTNVDGYVAEANSSVRLGSPKGDKALFVPKSDSQKLIDKSRAGEEMGVKKASQNGQLIGDSTNQGPLYNDKFRFRDPYNNVYKGWMFVADAGVWAFKKQLQFAVTAGATSGDDNPNFNVVDGNYQGFIPLQCIYSGKRVRSAFVLGGQGKLKRPISAPEQDQVPTEFGIDLSGFSNLVLAGAGMTWKPADVKKKYSVMTNFLSYWLQYPYKKFDLLTKKDSKINARTYLGSEANIFLNYDLLKDLKLYCVSSIFFPGTYYTDIRGKPLNAAQNAALETFDFSGEVDGQPVPNISNNVAYTVNIGMEFRF
jgi:hypothetical protein